MSANPITLQERIHVSRRGVTGTKECRIDWADRFDASLPKVGDSFDLANPYLRCTDIDYEHVDADGGILTFTYSTEGQLGDSFYERSISFGAEVDNATTGWTWETAGTPVSEGVNTYRSVGSLVISMRRATSPLAAIQSANNKVNDRTFQGFAAGTLLFNDADMRENWDQDGNLISVNTSFKFAWRERSWNYSWRPPRQKILDGVPQTYQTGEPDKPNYTANASLDSTPVYVSGTAGTGDWDKPKKGSAYVYGTSCDFATVLGIPKIPGDG